MFKVKKLYNFIFFQKNPSVRLDIFRFFFFGFNFFLYASLNLESYSIIPLELWDPHITFSFLNLHELTSSALKYIGLFFKVFLFFSAVGFLTSYSVVISTILFFIVVAINKSFISSNFHEQLPFLCMLVFCFTNCAGKLSLDFFIFKKNPVLSTHWPYRLLLFATSMMYFNAAISKVRNSGPHWFSGETLQVALNQSFLNFSWIKSDFFREILLTQFNNSLFLKLSALIVFLFEFLSPISLLNFQMQRLWVCMWVLFHLIIFLTIGISSSMTFIPIFLVLYPYSKSFLQKFRIGL